MTEDLKKRVENILARANMIKQFSIASEIDADAIEFLEWASLLKELKEREEKLVAILKYIDDMWGGDAGFEEERRCCDKIGGDSPVFIAWKEIRGAVKELGIDSSTTQEG